MELIATVPTSSLQPRVLIGALKYMIFAVPCQDNRDDKNYRDNQDYQELPSVSMHSSLGISHGTGRKFSTATWQTAPIFLRSPDLSLRSL